MQTEKHLTIFQDKGYMIWVNKKEIPSKSQVSIHKCIWFCKRTIPLFLSDRTPIGVKYLRISIESEEAHWIKGETSSQTEKKSSCLQWQHLMVVVLQHTDNNYHQPDVMKKHFFCLFFYTKISLFQWILLKSASLQNCVKSWWTNLWYWTASNRINAWPHARNSNISCLIS